MAETNGGIETMPGSGGREWPARVEQVINTAPPRVAAARSEACVTGDPGRMGE